MIKKLLVFCLCLILTGCGYKTDKQVVIQFSTWGSASEMKILTPIIAEFEKENPTVKIELMHIPQDYFKKLHLLFASNLAPDVIFINNLNLPVYEKYLESLDNDINKSEYFSQSISAMSYNNHLYAVPRDVSIMVIYYNKDLFKKYNISYPSYDWTLDDMFKISRKLTRDNIFGISFEPKTYYALPYIKAFGGDIYDDSYKQGAEYYKALAYKYKVAPLPSDVGAKTLAQMFLEEKIAMHFTGRWLVPKYRECAKFDWDIINFPNCYSPCDASGWAVSKYSKNKDMAIKFVLFLSKKKNIEQMTKDGLIVPARRDVAYSNVFLLGKPNNSKAFLYAVEHSQNTNISKDYNKRIDKLTDRIFNY